MSRGVGASSCAGPAELVVLQLDLGAGDWTVGIDDVDVERDPSTDDHVFHFDPPATVRRWPFHGPGDPCSLHADAKIGRERIETHILTTELERRCELEATLPIRARRRRRKVISRERDRRIRDRKASFVDDAADELRRTWISRIDGGGRGVGVARRSGLRLP
jgi:hypothetical protein